MAAVYPTPMQFASPLPAGSILPVFGEDGFLLPPGRGGVLSPARPCPRHPTRRFAPPAPNTGGIVGSLPAHLPHAPDFVRIGGEHQVLAGDVICRLREERQDVGALLDQRER